MSFEFKDAFLYGELAQEVYNDAGGRPEGWKVVGNSRDMFGQESTTGFYAAVYSREVKDSSGDSVKEYAIAYRGTDSALDWVKGNAPMAVGRAPLQLTEALRFAQLVSETQSVALNQIAYTGHSLGGALAQIVGMAVESNRPVYVFNSPGVGSVIDSAQKTVRDVLGGQHTLSPTAYHERIVEVRNDDDLVSHLPTLSHVGSIVELNGRGTTVSQQVVMAMGSVTAFEFSGPTGVSLSYATYETVKREHAMTTLWEVMKNEEAKSASQVTTVQEFQERAGTLESVILKNNAQHGDIIPSTLEWLGRGKGGVSGETLKAIENTEALFKGRFGPGKAVSKVIISDIGNDASDSTPATVNLSHETGAVWVAGTRQSDQMTSGVGNDLLIGGQGLDEYRFNALFGKDTIVDVDGGRIFMNGVELKGEAYAIGAGEYQFGAYRLTKVDNRLVGGTEHDLVIRNMAGDEITIQGFENDKFGIRLEEVTLDTAQFTATTTQTKASNLSIWTPDFRGPDLQVDLPKLNAEINLQQASLGIDGSPITSAAGAVANGVSQAVLTAVETALKEQVLNAIMGTIPALQIMTENPPKVSSVEDLRYFRGRPLLASLRFRGLELPRVLRTTEVSNWDKLHMPKWVGKAVDGERMAA